MNKKILTSVLAMFVLSACFSIDLPASGVLGRFGQVPDSIPNADTYELLPGESLEVLCPVPLEGELHGTSWVVICPGSNIPPTVTPIPPTDTPIPGAGIRDGVPLCADHDPAAWHDMYNEQQDCHYDHHHGRDPADTEIVALLGDPYQYTGQGISYQWQTHHEDEMKHRAYYWMWQINDQCVNSLVGKLCVKAFRFELHGDMGVIGAKARFHSYWSEILACEIGTDNCGVVRFGGWVDTGCLYDNYFGELRALPDDPPNCLPFPNGNAYRIFNQPRDKNVVLFQWNNGNWPAPGGSVAGHKAGHILWGTGQAYSNYAQPTMRNLVFGFLDNWSVAPADNLDAWEYICDDFQCPFNGSLAQVANFTTATFPAGSDFYYTDVRGFRDNTCTETGPECVPFVLEEWPGGNAGYHRNQQYKGGLNGFPYHPRDVQTFYEFDQSPAQLGLGSEWWLVPTDYGE